MSDVHQLAERHLRFHRRQWIIYFIGCAAMAVGTVAAVLTTAPGGNANAEFVLVPTGALFALMIILGLMERVRHREEYAREKQRIWKDEWMLRGMHRATGSALRWVIFIQAPLMFFMALVPPEPSVVGMGCMTVALGCALWAASYLYHTREPTDG